MALNDGHKYPVVCFLQCVSVFLSRFQQSKFEYIDVSPLEDFFVHRKNTPSYFRYWKVIVAESYILTEAKAYPHKLSLPSAYSSNLEP